jgi:hypothetical protein
LGGKPRESARMCGRGKDERMSIRLRIEGFDTTQNEAQTKERRKKERTSVRRDRGRCTPRSGKEKRAGPIGSELEPHPCSQHYRSIRIVGISDSYDAVQIIHVLRFGICRSTFVLSLYPNGFTAERRCLAVLCINIRIPPYMTCTHNGQCVVWMCRLPFSGTYIFLSK